MFIPRPPRNTSTRRRGAYAERISRRSRSMNTVAPWEGNCRSVASRPRRRSTRSRIIRSPRTSRFKPLSAGSRVRGRAHRGGDALELRLPPPELLLPVEEVERFLLEDLHPLVHLAPRGLEVAFRRGPVRGFDLREERLR